MSSATVGMVRPQVAPLTGGVFGRPPMPPPVPEKQKRVKPRVQGNGDVKPKPVKADIKSNKMNKPADPISVMSGGAKKKGVKYGSE